MSEDMVQATTSPVAGSGAVNVPDEALEEKVARAIYNAAYFSGHCLEGSWEATDDSVKDEFRRDARAAIVALAIIETESDSPVPREVIASPGTMTPKERARATDLMSKLAHPTTKQAAMEAITTAIREAVEAEREANAKIADWKENMHTDKFASASEADLETLEVVHAVSSKCARDIAAAIRSRTEGGQPNE